MYIRWYNQYVSTLNKFIKHNKFAGKEQDLYNYILSQNQQSNKFIILNSCHPKGEWDKWFYFQLYFANTGETKGDMGQARLNSIRQQWIESGNELAVASTLQQLPRHVCNVDF